MSDDKLWDDASAEWISLSELDKRDLLVFPKEIKSAPKKNVKKGEDPNYEYLLADVWILSGPTIEKIETVPMFVEDMRFTPGPIRAQGKRSMSKAKMQEKPFATFLGRMNSQKTSHGPDSRSYAIGPCDPGDPENPASMERAKKLVALAQAKYAEYEKFLAAKMAANIDSASDDDIFE